MLDMRIDQVRDLFNESKIDFLSKYKNDLLNICEKNRNDLGEEIFLIVLKVVDEIYNVHNNET